ncbi:hypothetical protein Syn7502_03259 [Synechococcus sp. PCC 7502]|nr:hypothetical protein Syn7502_03259 [Synechococcus sp. PCC 7502]
MFGISVVITCYCECELIYVAITSILSQSVFRVFNSK